MLAVTFESSFGDKFMYQHAMKAPDEMKKAQLQAQEQERIAWENAIPCWFHFAVMKASDTRGRTTARQRVNGESRCRQHETLIL